jgi:hypothetical protein
MNKPKSATCRAACVAAGVGIGGFSGTVIGGALRAGGGTLVAPGVGTIGGGGAGAVYGGGLGAVLGGLGGNALANAICPEEDDCERKYTREHDGECVAIAGARYGKRGIAVCQHSATQRYSECLRFGIEGIKTPLAGVDTEL